MSNFFPPLGLWIDDPKARVLEPAYWDDLYSLGVTTAAIMIDRSTAAWDPFWSAAELEVVGQFAIERDMELVLTVWTTPVQAELDRMFADLPELLCCGAAALEFDKEHLWQTSKVRRPFRSLLEAERYFLERLIPMAERTDTRIELTAHTGRPQTRLVPKFHRYNLQVYSVARRNKFPVPWLDPRRGPGKLQRFYLARARKIQGLKKLGAGLPLFGQKWPGHSRTEAMEHALDGALKYGPLSEVRYWSSKCLRPWRSGSDEIREFLRTQWGR